MLIVALMAALFGLTLIGIEVAVFGATVVVLTACALCSWLCAVSLAYSMMDRCLVSYCQWRYGS